MQNPRVPVLGFAAFSGTGKTTLITQLIPLLKAAGIQLGVIKHSHHNFEIDKPGKDSYRIRTAGASPVLIVSSHRQAIITEYPEIIEPKLSDQLIALNQSSVDLILVEGFKAEKFPKIELHRPVLNKPLLYPNDPTIIAIASDQKLMTPSYLTQLDLNDVPMISSYIIKHCLNTRS